MHLCFEVSLAEEGMKLGPFLRRKGLSASLVRRLKYEENGLQVEAERAKTNLILKAGQEVCVQLPKDDMSVQAEKMALSIVYEDEHVMVLNKPAALVMHPTRSHKSGTLANGFAHLMQERSCSTTFRPIGRLDADTSGLVLCAMNACVAPQLAKSLHKMYVALIEGEVKEDGVVKASLAQREDSAILQCVNPNGKPSETEYRVLAYSKTKSLVALLPKTGRTHQIRVHMAHLGHPLLGDELYGGAKIQISRHALHCQEISFCYLQKPIKQFFAPLPRDMQACMLKDKWIFTEKGKHWKTCQKFDIIV